MRRLPPQFADFPESDAESGWWGPLAAMRPEVASPLPTIGEPFRVTFVGQRTYFELCSQIDPSPVIAPTFVEHRAGADVGSLRSRIEASTPHVVVTFRPEIFPPGLLAGLDAIVLGYLTEPLPRDSGEPHPDLARRLHDLAKIDASQFDRIVSFDPRIVGAASRYTPVWRSCPLPVDDRVYGWRPFPARHHDIVFIGRSTDHREGFLQPAKHIYDLTHIEHGLFGERLVETLQQRTDVALNLHNEPYPTFENRVPMHLAAGNLVISEPLSPSNGLEPGIDFVEIDDPEDLNHVLGRLRITPEQFEMIRIRGRAKAEHFRATRVWARLIHDLLLDVAAFGTAREGRQR